MGEENELLRQQLEQISAILAEEDAALTAERALRVVAEAGILEGIIGGMNGDGAVLEAQRAITKQTC